MILLWGIEDDGPLDVVREALQRLGAPVFFLDQRRSADTTIEFCAGASVEGQIQLAGAVCDLAGITGVYIRSHESRSLLANAEADSSGTRHAQNLDEAVSAFLDASPARILNRLEAMASNNSKPYQLALIRAGGFAVPDTLVTTDPAAAKAFLAQHGEIIYKSVSGVRSIVSRLSAGHLERLEDITWCPTQFQQFIPGRDHRVHVVGDAVFACEILSDADDYRYAGRTGDPAQLKATQIPPALARKCCALAAALGLPVAGIDLRLTRQGEWVCFEVNPSPAFTYYEAATGAPIADAIAALLAAEG